MLELPWLAEGLEGQSSERNISKSLYFQYKNKAGVREVSVKPPILWSHMPNVMQLQCHPPEIHFKMILVIMEAWRLLTVAHILQLLEAVGPFLASCPGLQTHVLQRVAAEMGKEVGVEVHAAGQTGLAGEGAVQTHAARWRQFRVTSAELCVSPLRFNDQGCWVSSVQHALCLCEDKLLQSLQCFLDT